LSFGSNLIRGFGPPKTVDFDRFLKKVLVKRGGSGPGGKPGGKRGGNRGGNRGGVGKTWGGGNGGRDEGPSMALSRNFTQAVVTSLGDRKAVVKLFSYEADP